MKKNDNIKLDMVSNIDEAIVNEATDQRIALSKKAAGAAILWRKRFLALGSMAASFLVVCSLLLLFFLPDDPQNPPATTPTVTNPPILQQVPVYRGMTVSGQATPAPASAEASGRLRDLEKQRLQSTKGSHSSADRGFPEHFGNSLDVVGTNSAMYYTQPNQDIYITVHIDNPAQYEILSFTLNGVKYQSYMFETGSTSEALILKLNVGAVEGIVEYTIDAIKYVEETVIKDVRMDGDKTVKVGVYTENQPDAALTNQTVSYFEIGFDVAITDALGLIEKSSGQIYAAIAGEFDEKLIQKKKIAPDKLTSVQFEDLMPGKTYKLMIIACYDALDGTGFSGYILHQQLVSTSAKVTVTNVSTPQGTNSITFGLDMPEGTDIEKCELLSETGLVYRSVPGAVSEFSMILEGRYKIVVTYSSQDPAGQGKVTGVAESGYYDINMNFACTMTGGSITNPYAPSLTYNPNLGAWAAHAGVDVSSNTDSSVYALINGTVTQVYEEENYGKAIILSYTRQLADGSRQLIEIRYKSLGEIFVQEGQELQGGEKIGVAGTCTAEAADPDHVHIELFIDGVLANPQLPLRLSTFDAQPGSQCPSYEVPIIDGSGVTGQTIDPASTGKVTVITFWGNWCAICADNMVSLDQLAEKYADSLTVVAVHSQMGGDNLSSYIAKNYADSKIIFSKDDGTYYYCMGGQDSYPYTLILDEAGVVREVIWEGISLEQWEHRIQNAMQEAIPLP